MAAATRLKREDSRDGGKEKNEVLEARVSLV